MKKKTVIIHPHIKATFSNLNLDLHSELNRYEQYLNSASDSYHSDKNNTQSAIATLEKPVVTLQQSEENTIQEKVSLPPLQYHSIIREPEEEIDSIPIASRIINRQKSFLDTLLTPWGIFGLILFFGANALIFIGRDLYQESTANITSVTETEAQQFDTNDYSQISTLSTENNSSSSPTQKNEILTINNPADTQINFAVEKTKPPSIPISLANIDNNNRINRNRTVPYADFKTALLSEAETFYQIQLPPPPPIISLKSTDNSTFTTPLANKPSRINNNNQSYPPQNAIAPLETATTNLVKPVMEANERHYIVTKYKSMDNYTQIKSIIPQALISNIEKEIVIQLGVFSDKSSAQQYHQKMKSKGIPTNLISVSE